MTWEERLLFLMFLDYKGVLKKWEKNHNKCKDKDYEKIDDVGFEDTGGFDWSMSGEGKDFWYDIIMEWNSINIEDDFSYELLEGF